MKDTPHYVPSSQPPHLPLYTLPQSMPPASSSAAFHQTAHSNAGQHSESESRDLLGQLELLKKREQMLQTAKIQLEEKCATLLDKVDTMETKEHVRNA